MNRWSQNGLFKQL